MELWVQTYTPVGESLGLSAVVAAIPIFVLFLMLAVLRKAAWMAAVSALASALVVALFVYGIPAHLALNSTISGAAYGIFPIAWIVFTSILLYRLAVDGGKFRSSRIRSAASRATAACRRVHRVFVRRAIEGAAGSARRWRSARARRSRLRPVFRRRHLSAGEHGAGRV